MMDQAKSPTTIDRGRYRRIIRFFSSAIRQIVWWEVILARFAPEKVKQTRMDRLRRIARNFREMAVKMGGVMIKAGQFLSSRVDVLPAEVTQELAGLQDEVPPEPIEAIHQVIIQELGRPPEKIFNAFEQKPQAAASLGQTHRARLPDGDGGFPIIIKVQRLNIEHLVKTDLEALRVVARWVMLYPPIRRRVDVPALVKEFAKTTWAELDYVAEADNARRFKAIFANDPGVYIPAVYPDHSTKRVLVLEDVEQIKITDGVGLEKAKIDRAQVAKKLMDVYLYQVFEVGFFHADPHPGNIFVRPLEKQSDGTRSFQLVFVDFGMVGRLPPIMGEPLREIVRGMTLRDGHRLVQAFKDLHFFLPGADLGRVEEAVDVVLDRFWGMNMQELSSFDPAQFQDLALEFRDLLFELPFQVPQDFIFLGRAIGILSGLALTLDPKFSPWGPLELYGKRLLQKEREWPGVKESLKLAAESLRPLITLPSHLETFLVRSGRGDLKIQAAPDQQFQKQLRQIDNSIRRLYWGIVFSTLALGGTFLFIYRQMIPAWIGWGAAGLVLVWSLISGRRR